MKAVGKKRFKTKTVAIEKPSEAEHSLNRLDEERFRLMDRRPDSSEDEQDAEIYRHIERKQQLGRHLDLLDDPAFQQWLQQLGEQLKQRYQLSFPQLSMLEAEWQWLERERRLNEGLAMAEEYLRRANKHTITPPATSMRSNGHDEQLLCPQT